MVMSFMKNILLVISKEFRLALPEGSLKTAVKDCFQLYFYLLFYADMPGG